MSEELQWRITSFFDYWRERHAFIRDLDFSKHSHEANVLLWGELDQLSNLWAGNIGSKQCGKKMGKRNIFDAFLARYGGELFQLVSLPDIWNRVDKGKAADLPENIRTFLGTVGGRCTPTVLQEQRTRCSSEDWSLDATITRTLANYPEMDRTKLEEWLTFSRYGAIAYKQMRCAYIHEGRPGKGTHSFKLHGFAERPTYRSAIYATPPIMGFDIEFMLRVLGFCIDEFEADALALQADPVPE
ncbi:hypothetical protein NDI49_26955 [Trichocoleus sp. ST-U3]